MSINSVFLRSIRRTIMRIAFSILSIVFMTAPVYAEQSPNYQVIGKNIFGLIMDVDMDPLLVESSEIIHTTPTEQIEIGANDTVYNVASFEYAIGSVYLTKLENKSDISINTFPLDAALIGGISRPSGPVISSWNTILYSEKVDIDSKKPRNFISEYSHYFKGDRSKVNPYNFGWSIEMVLLDPAIDSKLIKNYAMGRTGASQLLVMPDNKTVYLINNHGYVYVFIADEPKNLSSGKLYGVSLHKNAIKLVPIADTNTLKVKYRLRKTGFDKLFNQAELNDGDCPEGFHKVDMGFDTECISIKDKYYAGVFEPNRVAAIKGVAPVVGSIKGLGFDNQTLTIKIIRNENSPLEFALGESLKHESNYLIKERL